MTTINFDNVYMLGRATAVGPMEQKGPIGHMFDKAYDDNYCNEGTFEKAERTLVYQACDTALRKADLHVEDIEIVCGGDLINQLTSSHYFARDIDVPFIGMYGACSNSSLVISQAAIWVENQMAKHALAFTSSHVATAERQFRFPNEYGIQKKPTTTLTVTGAGAVILGRQKSAIKVASFTPGKIIDWDHKDANDMGLAMAPAAFDTLQTHFKDTGRSFEDYDMIVTGDLSKIGFSFLTDLLVQKGYNLHNRLHDCGLMIYDFKEQDAFCGGSGCACSMCVSLAKLLQHLEDNEMKRIMVIATGALLSPVAVQQKETIPCIAHAIVYERGE
ncbi:MAG: stage V sporulation protein AD [Erysipelotrichaceae bacterium]|jgi:stage V sporulation protein AD|nr:stage V sporulation protein AD [Erysipelotrichaceae bacterium]